MGAATRFSFAIPNTSDSETPEDFPELGKQGSLFARGVPLYRIASDRDRIR